MNSNSPNSGEGMYERPDTDDEALQGCKLQYKLDLSAVTTGI